MIFSKICHLRKIVFDQSSQVHHVSESRVGRGGIKSITNGKGRKFLCLIFDNTLCIIRATSYSVTNIIKAKGLERPRLIGKVLVWEPVSKEKRLLVLS